MVGLYEFKMMPLAAQAEYIWDNGKFLATRRAGRFTINLYYLGSYFAEVMYAADNLNEIADIRTFISKRNLGSYNVDIDLDTL